MQAVLCCPRFVEDVNSIIGLVRNMLQVVYTSVHIVSTLVHARNIFLNFHTYINNHV